MSKRRFIKTSYSYIKIIFSSVAYIYSLSIFNVSLITLVGFTLNFEFFYMIEGVSSSYLDKLRYLIVALPWPSV